MTTVSDDFNRSNEDLTADSNWNAGSENVFEISSNQVQVKSGVTGNTTKTVFDGSTFANDQQCSAKILTLAPGGDAYWGIVVRGATGGALAGYSAEVQSNGDVEVYKSYYDLVVDVAAGLTANDKLTIRAEGTTITVYVNDVEKGSGTDSGLASGDPGFVAEVDSSGDATPLFDEFSATDVLGNNFTLVAVSGTYTYSGTAGDLNEGRVLALDSGTYSYLGTSVALQRGLVIPAASGTYTYLGTAMDISSCSGYARITISSTLTLGSSFGSELTALGLNNGVSWDNAAAGSQSVHHVRLTGAKITSLIAAIDDHIP